MTEKPDQRPDPNLDPKPDSGEDLQEDLEDAMDVASMTPEEQIDALTAKNAELLNRLMRLTAEFDNYRKRVSREQLEWRARAVEGLVLDLLPVQDSFDRAIESADDSAGAAGAAGILEGMELVHRQLVGALERHGVKPIQALGEAFDPQLHEAFSSRPVEEGEKPGTLVLEIEKGYVMGDRTIRATKGIVAVAPEGDSGESPEEV